MTRSNWSIKMDCTFLGAFFASFFYFMSYFFICFDNHFLRKKENKHVFRWVGRQAGSVRS